jgi:hypothetical protein
MQPTKVMLTFGSSAPSTTKTEISQSSVTWFSRKKKNCSKHVWKQNGNTNIQNYEGVNGRNYVIKRTEDVESMYFRKEELIRCGQGRCVMFQLSSTDWEKPRKISVKIAANPAEVWTGYLSRTGEERYS